MYSTTYFYLRRSLQVKGTKRVVLVVDLEHFFLIKKEFSGTEVQFVLGVQIPN